MTIMSEKAKSEKNGQNDKMETYNKTLEMRKLTDMTKSAVKKSKNGHFHAKRRSARQTKDTAMPSRWPDQEKKNNIFRDCLDIHSKSFRCKLYSRDRQ